MQMIEAYWREARRQPVDGSATLRPSHTGHSRHQRNLQTMERTTLSRFQHHRRSQTKIMQELDLTQ